MWARAIVSAKVELPNLERNIFFYGCVQWILAENIYFGEIKKLLMFLNQTSFYFIFFPWL